MEVREGTWKYFIVHRWTYTQDRRELHGSTKKKIEGYEINTQRYLEMHRISEAERDYPTKFQMSVIPSCGKLLTFSCKADVKT